MFTLHLEYHKLCAIKTLTYLCLFIQISLVQNISPMNIKFFVMENESILYLCTQEVFAVKLIIIVYVLETILSIYVIAKLENTLRFTLFRYC